MLEQILAGILDSKEKDSRLEAWKEKAVVPEVEQAMKELVERYPNTKMARRLIRGEIEGIAEMFSKAVSIADILEPSQQVVMYDYMIAVLKISLYQIQDYRNEVLESAKNSETSDTAKA